MNETTSHIHTPKKNKVWQFLKRFVLIGFCISVVLIITSVALVFVYEKQVKALIVSELNKHLNAEVIISPDDIDLTLLRTFPNCALEFKNFTIFEASKSKQRDTLATVKNLALEFNVKDLYYKNYNIKQIRLTDAKANLKVDKYGNPNYIIWKTSKDTLGDNDSLNFSLEKIVVKNCDFKYKNSFKKINIKAMFDELHFSGDFKSNQYELKANGNGFVKLFQLDKVKYLQQKNIQFDVIFAVDGNTYTFKKAETKINKTLLVSSGSFVVKDSLEALDLKFNGENLDISSTISMLPESFQNHLNDYESSGEFYAVGECHYSIKKPLELTSIFGIKNTSIRYKPKNTTLTNVNLIGKISIENKISELMLNNISANLNNNSFNGNLSISNFNDPYLKLDFQANTKLEDLINFYPIDTLESLSGSIAIKAQIEGLVNEMKSNVLHPTIKSNGSATINEIKAKLKHSEKEVNVPYGELTLLDKSLFVNTLQIIKGNSNISLQGDMPNFLGFLFDTTLPFTINATLTSDNIELEDFVFKNNANNATEAKPINIADNLDFNISANVKKLSFGKFLATDVNGKLALKNHKVALNELAFNTCEGKIGLNAIAVVGENNVMITGNCDMQKLNIQQLFIQMNNFGQNTLQDHNVNGFVTATTDFSVSWDKLLNLDLNSIKTISNILIERGELNNFKPLESLGKYIDVKELQRIKFSSLQSNIEIKNKLITIPKTSIKSSVLNLELFGTHSFDNMVNYHIQLLISDLLAKRPREKKQLDEELALVENDAENRRSVFISMIGPIDNPVIKYDRKGAQQKVKEDIKQEKQNLKQLLKEEFGLFKKDTMKGKEIEKSNQKFKIDFGDKPKPIKKSNSTVGKSEDDDDF